MQPDSIRLYNDQPHSIRLIIEPCGTTLPFPRTVGLSVINAHEITFKENLITIYNNDNDFSIFIGKYEIFTTGGNRGPRPDIPNGMGTEEFMVIAQNRVSLIDKLLHNSRMAQILSERAANKPQLSDEWPLSTILIHLALVEDVIWQARLNQMAEQENPHWIWTEPSLDEAIAQQGQRPLAELAGLFEARRKQTLAHLEDLSEEGWARVGTHARLGQMDVAGLCAQILEHDEEHLAELNK